MEGRPQPVDPEELFADWLARSGTEEELEGLCRDHAEHAPALSKLREDWQRIHAILRRAGLGISAGVVESFALRLKHQYGSEVDPAIALEGAEERDKSPASTQLLARLAEHSLKGSRYQLRGQIAEGGMGAILKVWDEDLRRTLAMKVILGQTGGATGGETPHVDRRLLARFLEEAQVTGQLDHPGIVPVHELGLDAEGRVYFTMKLVKGRDLKTIFELVFEEQEGWNETRALGVILKVCEAMAYAHAKGVVHRDLKPANIMVGNFGEVYVMDWGLARVLGRQDQHDMRLKPEGTNLTSVKTERRAEREEAPDSPLFTMDGDIVGTPAYMPPEQALGEVERIGPHSDVYAIGAVLYHLLARQMPYVPPGARITNRTILGMVVQGPPRALSSLRLGIPAELAAICEKAMARQAQQRYRDTLSLAEDLRAYLERRVVKAYRTGALVELTHWVRRNQALAATLAAAFLFLVTGLTASLVFKQRSDRNAELAQVNSSLAEEHARQSARNAEAATNQAKAALANEQRAVEGEARALEREKEARWQTYLSSLLLADNAHRANEPGNLRRALDSAPTEHRGWEWHYLDAISNTSLLEVRQPDAIVSADFSPGGSQFVTASADGTACLWDSTSGESLAVLRGHEGPLRTAAFDGSGRWILTVSSDKTARVWDAQSGDYHVTLDLLDDSWHDVSFSRDGSRILANSWNAGSSRLWDVRSGVLVADLPGFASFSPDGWHVLTRGDGRFRTMNQGSTARIWTASDGALVRILQPEDDVTNAVFSPDGGRLAITTTNSGLTVCDALTGEHSLHWAGRFSRPMFSPDGTLVAVADDWAVRVFNTVSRQETARLSLTGEELSPLGFSPDGARLVVQSNKVDPRIWTLVGGKIEAPLAGVGNWTSLCAFVPDGSQLVTWSREQTIRVWDARTGQPHTVLSHADLSGCDLAPDGTRILTCSRDGSARVWETRATRGPEESPGKVIGFGADDTWFFTLSNGLNAWALEDGAPKGTLELGERPAILFGNVDAIVTPDARRIVMVTENATAVDPDHGAVNLSRSDQGWCAFSPDGKRIAITAVSSFGASPKVSYTVRVLDADSLWELSRSQWDLDAETIRGSVIWDADTGARLVDLPGPCDFMAFSPDGELLARASRDGTVRMLDARTGTPRYVQRAEEGSLTSCSFSSSGRSWITTGRDKTARVWDTSTGERRLVLQGHDSEVLAATYSPDEARILTLAADRTARLYDAASGVELLVLRDLPETFRGGLTFSPDGTRVLLSDYRGTLVLDSVPYRIRAERMRNRRACAEAALSGLERLAARYPSLAEVAASIREDPDLDPDSRAAMLEIALTSACDAAQLVRSLRQELLFPADVLAAIDSYVEATPLTKRHATALARSLTTDPDLYNDVAWEIVKSPIRTPDEYMKALLASEAAAQERPEWEIVNTFGIAEYRSELYEEALATLERSVALSGRNPPDSSDLAFLAMARFRLGLLDEARASLEELRAVMEAQQGHENADNEAFLREAEELIGGAGRSDG